MIFWRFIVKNHPKVIAVINSWPSCGNIELKVLIVMNEVGLVPLVHLLAGFLHVLGQSRWSAAEHTDFTHLSIKAGEKKCTYISHFSPPAE